MLGPVRERAGERDALALAAGEVLRQPPLEPGEPDQLDQLRDARLLSAGHAPQPAAAQPEPDVRRDRQVREERALLRDVADAAPLGRRVLARAVDDAAAERDRAASGRSRPAIRRSSVVLPLPEAPRIAVSEPVSATSETPLRTTRPPNDFSRPETATAMPPAARCSAHVGAASGDPLEPASEQHAGKHRDEQQRERVRSRGAVGEVRRVRPELGRERLDAGRVQHQRRGQLGGALRKTSEKPAIGAGHEQRKRDPHRAPTACRARATARLPRARSAPARRRRAPRRAPAGRT